MKNKLFYALIFIFLFPVLARGALGQSKSITGSFGIGGLVTFTFSAEKGSSFHIRVIDIKNDKFKPIVWLYKPKGDVIGPYADKTIVQFNCNPKDSFCRITESGIYRLVIADKSGENPGNFRIEFLNVSNPNQNLSGINAEASNNDNSNILKGSVNNQRSQSSSSDSGDTKAPGSDGNISKQDPLLESKITSWYENNIKKQTQPPEYLYRTGTRPENVSTAWMMLTDNLRSGGDQKELYDQLYNASLDFMNQRDFMLIEANRALKAEEIPIAEHYFNEAVRLDGLFNSTALAATNTYNNDLDSAYTLAEGVYKGSKAAFIYGSNMVLSPATASAVEKIFTVTDYHINKSKYGTKKAVNELIVNELVSASLNKVKLDALGGKTISDTLTSKSSKAFGSSELYNLMGKAFESDEVKKTFMKFIADSTDVLIEEGSEAALKEYIDLVKAIQEKLSAKL